MLVRTPGIVINQIRYSDNSIIVHIYTRQLGMKSYIVNNINAPKAAIKPGLLQPLTLLDLIVYNKPGHEIQRIKEAKANPPLSLLHFDVLRSSIGLFMAELVHRTVKEEESNEALYDFLNNFILILDHSQNLAVLPVYFSLHFSRFLGFFPQPGFDHQKIYFNLSEGKFMSSPDRPENTIESPHTQYLELLMQCTLGEIENIHIPRESRALLFSKLLDYYLLHIPGFRPLKSPAVLASLMKG